MNFASSGSSAAEPTPEAIDDALQAGELLRAGVLANQAWQHCLAEKHLTTQSASRLRQSLARTRAALSAPKRGAEYVSEAQRLSTAKQPEGARAAWARAQIAYRRETKQAPVLAREVTPSTPGQDLCAPSLVAPAVPGTRLEAWELASKPQQRLWKLFRADGSVQFSGRARAVWPITTESWLVVGEQVKLWREKHPPLALGRPSCESRFRRLGDWLIGSVQDGTAWVINLSNPERTFTRATEAGGDVTAARVGPYIAVEQDVDAGVRTQFIFPEDMTDPDSQVWTPPDSLAGPELSFSYLKKWGGVLLRRSVYSDAAAPVRGWLIEAIQLDSEKRLASLVMPVSVVTLPAATLDPRFGLVVAGEGRDVRVAAFGGNSARKLPAEEMVGQITHIATPDGLVCTNQVYIRYYSCAMHVTADLTGAGRQRAANRFCLNSAAGPWSGVVTPEPGLVHIGSGGANVSEVCGERMAADGSMAAFLEVKPKRGAEGPYAGAVVVVIDTKTGRRLRRLRVPGKMFDPQPFIDVSFSPDGAFVGVLFDRLAQVYRLSDGARVGQDLPADGWRAFAWLSSSAFSGGNTGDPVAELQGDAFRFPSTAPGSRAERCVFGELVTPAEVCTAQEHTAQEHTAQEHTAQEHAVPEQSAEKSQP